MHLQAHIYKHPFTLGWAFPIPLSLLLLQLPLAQARCCAAGWQQRVKPCSPWSRQEGLVSGGKKRGCGGDPPGRQPASRAGKQLAQVDLGPPMRAGSSRGGEGVWSEVGGRRGVDEASGEDGAAPVGRSAVLGSEGWAARRGSCAVSPSGDSQGVTVRTCLVVEEAAVLGGGRLHRDI